MTLPAKVWMSRGQLPLKLKAYLLLARKAPTPLQEAWGFVFLSGGCCNLAVEAPTPVVRASNSKPPSRSEVKGARCLAQAQQIRQFERLFLDGVVELDILSSPVRRAPSGRALEP